MAETKAFQMKRRYKTRFDHPQCRIPASGTPEGKVYKLKQHVRWLARKIYTRALARGRVEHWRGKKCVDCGADAQINDHRNYFYPIRVDPVCKFCDAKRGEGFPYLGTQTEKDYQEHSRRSGK